MHQTIRRNTVLFCCLQNNEILCIATNNVQAVFDRFLKKSMKIFLEIIFIKKTNHATFDGLPEFNKKIFTKHAK